MGPGQKFSKATTLSEVIFQLPRIWQPTRKFQGHFELLYHVANPCLEKLASIRYVAMLT